MPIRFHLDEHVHRAIALGLRRRGIDVTTTADAGLIGAPDEDHIEFALRERRVIFTQDEDFLALAARPTSRHWGIIFNKFGTKPIGQTFEFLELFHGCMSEDDTENYVEYF